MHEDWHRNAVIYQIDPSLFRDSNGDGRGDLRGVADRLDHLRALGANCTCRSIRGSVTSPISST